MGTDMMLTLALLLYHDNYFSDIHSPLISHSQSKLCRSLLSRHVLQLWRNHLLLHSMPLAKKVIRQIQKLLGIQFIQPQWTNHCL